MPRLLFVVNVDWFFISHRLPIAVAAIERGFEVHVATELTDSSRLLERHGLIVHNVPFNRGSYSVFGLLRSVYKLFFVVYKVRPHILHLITIKPVLIGGIVARLLAVPAKVSAISGLGFVFVSEGIFAGLRRLVIKALYRIALKHPNARIIFQNDADRQVILDLSGVSANQARMIAGSGVDLSFFNYSLPLDGAPIVMMAARLLFDKGVDEFVAAAKMTSLADARFVLVGDIDSGNPASLSQADYARLKEEGRVELWGHCIEMNEVLSQASIVVLPSYREGFPKVLLEAAACGRPVITTDVPGCRDAVVPGRTGLLVPVRDSRSLAGAIEKLVLDSSLRLRMGRAGRDWVEKEHAIQGVIEKHFLIYNELCNY